MKRATLPYATRSTTALGAPGRRSGSTVRSVKTHRHAPCEIEILDPTTDLTWDLTAASHRESTIFHSSAWARVLVSTYGHKPFYLRLLQDGKTAAVLPLMEVSSRLTGRRAVSLPFSDLAGALTFTEFNPQLLVKKLSDLARERGWKYFEIRGDRSFAPVAVKPAFVGHTLDLRIGLERLRGGVSSAVRRNLRKAKASGVEIAVGRNWEQLVEFYRLHLRTRRRHGLPPQSIRFFSNIYEHLLKRRLGFVVLAAIKSRPIAAAVFLHQGGRAVYKFGASDERFQQHRANNLVMWQGISSLVESGAEMLHFGRTSLENNGLRRFKLSWGSQEEPLTYSRFDPLRAEWRAPAATSKGFHHHVFGNLPLPVNRLIGTLCYPHLD